MSKDYDESALNEKELQSVRERKLAELKGKKPKADEPIHVTDTSFDEIIGKSTLALVDFWASWCGPCQALAPTIEELAREYSGKVLIGKLNVDENPQRAESFQVFSIPTMLILKNGKEVDRIVGCVQKKVIEAALKKYSEQD